MKEITGPAELGNFTNRTCAPSFMKSVVMSKLTRLEKRNKPESAVTCRGSGVLQ